MLASSSGNITPWASAIPAQGGSAPAAIGRHGTDETITSTFIEALDHRQQRVEIEGRVLTGFEGELEQPHGFFSAPGGPGLSEKWAVGTSVLTHSGECGALNRRVWAAPGPRRPRRRRRSRRRPCRSRTTPPVPPCDRPLRRPWRPPWRSPRPTATTFSTASGSSTTASAASRKARAAEISWRAAAWSGSRPSGPSAPVSSAPLSAPSSTGSSVGLTRTPPPARRRRGGHR